VASWHSLSAAEQQQLGLLLLSAQPTRWLMMVDDQCCLLECPSQLLRAHRVVRVPSK
jgi:hypothetical protein